MQQLEESKAEANAAVMVSLFVLVILGGFTDIPSKAMKDREIELVDVKTKCRKNEEVRLIAYRSER